MGSGSRQIAIGMANVVLSGDRVKLLLWDRSGWLLVYKRLERGVFRRPREAGPGAGHVLLEGPELALMLEGIDLRGARRRPRWEPQPSAR